MTPSNEPWYVGRATHSWGRCSDSPTQQFDSGPAARAGTPTAASRDSRVSPVGTEGERETHILGDPSKMRVQLTYDMESLTMGLKLTDQLTGDAMMANISPDMAMSVGDKMFKIGADLRAKKLGEES